MENLCETVFDSRKSSGFLLVASNIREFLPLVLLDKQSLKLLFVLKENRLHSTANRTGMSLRSRFWFLIVELDHVRKGNTPAHRHRRERSAVARVIVIAVAHSPPPPPSLRPNCTLTPTSRRRCGIDWANPALFRRLYCPSAACNETASTLFDPAWRGKTEGPALFFIGFLGDAPLLPFVLLKKFLFILSRDKD